MRIEEWRAEIDAVDNELLRLLNWRARLAVGLGTKPEAVSPREDDSLERACRANAGPLDERAVARIFRRIVRETQRARATGRPHRTALKGCALTEGGAAHEEVGELV